MKPKTLSHFCFGNHNTPNAIEDYVHFSLGVLMTISRTSFASRHIFSNADILVVQEDFDRCFADKVIAFKKISPQSKKLVIIATENIQGDSFNDIHELNKIASRKESLVELAQNQLKSQNLASFLYKKYLSRLKRDVLGFSKIFDRIRSDHLGVLHRRYLNFLHVAPYADQIWLMPGLDLEPYYKLFGDKVQTFPFVLRPSRPRFSEIINYHALLSGKISPHRRSLLNYLGLYEQRSGSVKKSWEELIITTSFDIPLSIRREILRTAGLYLDLPVSDGSKIFSSMKAAISLEVGTPFFSLSDANPGKFAPFVRTFADIRSLKEEIGRYSKEELVEVGAHFSSGAAKVHTPASYPFLEELLK